MSRTISNVVIASDSFYSWVVKTNETIEVLLDTVTVKANTAGDLTSGNGFVNGIFGANTLTATDIRGGNVTTNSVVTFTTNTNIGNSTVEVYSLQNNTASIRARSYGTTNTDPQILDSFSAASFRSGKYIISINSSVNDYQVTEIMLLQDGTNTYTTEYATLVSSSTLGTFSANIDSGTVRLFVVPASATNTIKYQRTLITA